MKADALTPRRRAACSWVKPSSLRLQRIISFIFTGYRLHAAMIPQPPQRSSGAALQPTAAKPARRSRPGPARPGALAAPPSTSVARRAVLCAALADGESRLANLAHSQDIDATLGAAMS